MTAQIVLAFLACSTAAAAQQVAPGQTLLLQPALEQPVERTGLGVAGEPAAPARGWSLTPTDQPDATLPDIVATQGPGVRVTTESAVTVFRPRWRLAGDFAVSAVFQAGAGMPAPYGLTVGGAAGTALLIRSDGAFAIQVSGTGAPIWSPVALRSSPDGAASNHLEIRVASGEASFLINGETVATLPIQPGELDGVPGVCVGSSGDVAVAGFAVRSATALIAPNGSR